jgi:hypothetical protein
VAIVERVKTFQFRDPKSLTMSNLKILKVIIIVLAVIGALAVISVVGMWVMHETMMGGMTGGNRIMSGG